VKVGECQLSITRRITVEVGAASLDYGSSDLFHHAGSRYRSSCHGHLRPPPRRPQVGGTHSLGGSFRHDHGSLKLSSMDRRTILFVIINSVVQADPVRLRRVWVFVLITVRTPTLLLPEFLALKQPQNLVLPGSYKPAKVLEANDSEFRRVAAETAIIKSMQALDAITTRYDALTEGRTAELRQMMATAFNFAAVQMSGDLGKRITALVESGKLEVRRRGMVDASEPNRAAGNGYQSAGGAVDRDH
jgi:hypothetical protein